MLVAASVSKHYAGRAVLIDVSLRCDRGEILGVIGANGAGKTTLLRILVGALDADAAGAEPPERQPIGYLPEHNPLPVELTVHAHLRFQAGIKGVEPAAIEPALRDADVLDLRARVIGTLSKGQRQRVGLAEALLGAPPALVLDEPTAGLDPVQAQAFRKLLRVRKQGAAIVLSSHVVGEMAAICDRLLVLARGRVVATGTPVELVAATGCADLEGAVLALVGSGAA